jgi:hypothetical protein
MMHCGPCLCGLQAVLGAASAARAQRTDALNLATAGTGYGMLCQVRLVPNLASNQAGSARRLGPLQLRLLSERTHPL